MNYRPALEHALRIHGARDDLTRDQKAEAATSLAGYGVFSNDHIARFTGLRPKLVSELTGKSDRTGGRLYPAAIPHILDVIRADRRSEIDSRLIVAAIGAGVSGNMLAKLTGLSQSTVSRLSRRDVA